MTLSGEWQKRYPVRNPWAPGETLQRVSSTTRGIEAKSVGGEPFVHSAFVVFSTYRKRSPVQTMSVSGSPVWSKTVARTGGADAEVSRTASRATARNTVRSVLPRTSLRQPERDEPPGAAPARDPDRHEEPVAAHRR